MPCDVIPLPVRPSVPAASSLEQAALRAHQEAANALAMAMHHLRASAGNIPRAAQKAAQAAAALQTLHELACEQRRAL